MGCPVLNEDRIDLILRGTLPGPDRAQLIAHLAEPCEQCLNTLSGPAGDELLGPLPARR